MSTVQTALFCSRQDASGRGAHLACARKDHSARRRRIVAAWLCAWPRALSVTHRLAQRGADRSLEGCPGIADPELPRPWGAAVGLAGAKLGKADSDEETISDAQTRDCDRGAVGPAAECRLRSRATIQGLIVGLGCRVRGPRRPLATITATTCGHGDDLWSRRRLVVTATTCGHGDDLRSRRRRPAGWCLRAPRLACAAAICEPPTPRACTWYAYSSACTSDSEVVRPRGCNSTRRAAPRAGRGGGRCVERRL